MTTLLGGGGSIPVCNTKPIEIPQSEAPEKVLRLDEKIPLPPLYTGSGAVESFKFLASGSDTLPGYLLAKIDPNQFSIITNKLHLDNLNGLTTDDLNEGSTNLYLNQTNFDTFFGAKTTDGLTQGVTNLYYATTLFNTDFGTKTTDNLTEGSSNKYMSAQNLSDINDNTSARHTHTNKSLLDSYSNSNSSISSAITNSHTHANKAILDGTQEAFTTLLKDKYDNFESGAITSVLSPLILNVGVLSHSAIDGNKHVPSNSGASQHFVLASGINAGTYVWESPLDSINAFGAFEATPSASTTTGVQSAYINTHISNGTADVNHLTNAEVNYLNTTIPSHIASILLHLPAIAATVDQGKFLWVNTSDEPEWTTSATNIQTTGETYITASGDTITIGKPSLDQTLLEEGSNITFSGNQISSAQRAISSSSIDSNTTTSISAGWAYTHEQILGATGHIPGGGTEDQYIAGDGTIKDFTSAPGQIYKITMGYGADGTVAERIADGATTFPAGWSGAVGAISTDMEVTHTALKNIIDVIIYSDDGTDITKLIGSAAYATIIGNQTLDLINIVSLSTINNTIHIYMQFE